MNFFKLLSVSINTLIMKLIQLKSMNKIWLAAEHMIFWVHDEGFILAQTVPLRQTTVWMLGFA